MENDIPNSSNSEKYQITWGSDGGIISQVKCYRCSFCKKGFSNAQALGGHMNIHRKDRAKLREISIETSDIKKSVSPSPDPDHIQAPSNTDELILQQDISSDDTSSPSKRPCVTLEQQQQQHHHHHHHPISKEKDENHELVIGGDLLQLPLFVDSPSKEEINCVETQEVHNKGMKLSIDDSKLDLELRLGPESSVKP